MLQTVGGLGGARILLYGFSDRRYTVSATSPDSRAGARRILQKLLTNPYISPFKYRLLFPLRTKKPGATLVTPGLANVRSSCCTECHL